MFLFFGLSSLLLIQTDSKGNIKDIGIIALLLGSLLSKETGILFLIVIPVYQKLFKNKWQPALAQAGVALLIYLFLRIGVAHIYLNSEEVFRFQLMQLTLLQRMINVPEIIFFYIRIFFYPDNLLVYQRWVITGINFQNFYLPLLLDLIFIIPLGFYGYRIYKKHFVQFKIYLFFLTWFILGIGAHLHIIPLDYTIADRWFYLPIIGLLGMIATLISTIQVKRKFIKPLFLLVLAVIIGAFSIRDIVRNRNWSDAFTLYLHDIQIDPDNYALQSGLGIELLTGGNLTKPKAICCILFAFFQTTRI